MNDKRLKVILLALLDALCINLAYILALLIRFDFSASSTQFGSFLGSYISGFAVITLLKLAMFALCGLYSCLWRYAGIREFSMTALACVAGDLLAILYLGLRRQPLPRSVYLIVLLLDLVFVCGIRFICKILGRGRSTGARRVLIVGAGNAGAMLIDGLRLRREQDLSVVAAVDDDPAKKGKWINGVKVMGVREDIPRLVRRCHIDEILITLPTASKAQIREIYDICRKTKCRIKIMPPFMELLDEDVVTRSPKSFDMDELLGREPADIDLKGVSKYLEERIVLVTGAGGSVGSELCRQIAAFRPRRVIMLDICEENVFALEGELNGLYPQLQTDAVIASVCDFDSMDAVFSRYRPHVVFHAAAHKHVPLMEENPREALVNNFAGTAVVMDLAERSLANHFVLISTSKAVYPGSVMGATKRLCELEMQYKSRQARCCFSAVRFGNVLGSSGSVIPIFQRQIAEGGPVTVTHADASRYFMTVSEAARLVIQAGSMARGGEIFVLDMGQPVRILDLAEKVIRLSGFEPYVDIDIEITGLRPGEKISEELMMAEEGLSETSHSKIFVGHPAPLPEGLRGLLEGEGGACACIGQTRGMSAGEVRAYIKGLLPSYAESSITRN